jgi:hypothetical protein
MKCVECQCGKAVSVDPRDPPLELDECLCLDCGESAYDERIEELEQELEQLRCEKRSLRKGDKND